MTTRRGTLALAVLGRPRPALIALELALGALSFGEPHLADPCTSKPAFSGGGIDGATQRFALATLAGAACELHTTREELVLSFVPNAGTERIHWDQRDDRRRPQGGPRPRRRGHRRQRASQARRWPSRCASSSRPRSRGSSEQPTAPDFSPGSGAPGPSGAPRASTPASSWSEWSRTASRLQTRIDPGQLDRRRFRHGNAAADLGLRPRRALRRGAPRGAPARAKGDQDVSHSPGPAGQVVASRGCTSLREGDRASGP